MTWSNLPLEWLAALVVPAPEEADARQILAAVQSLEGFVRDFDMAVRLFDEVTAQAQKVRDRYKAGEVDRSAWSNTNAVFSAWRRIAARDGAFQIYHVGAVIQSIRGALHHAPTLRSLIENQKTRIAWQLFESYFPHHTLIRDAVGHSIYELAPDEKRRKKHAVSGTVEIAGLVRRGTIEDLLAYGLQGHNFIVTKDKKVASYEISAASHAKLESVRQHFVAGFERARQEATERLMRKAQSLGEAQPPSN